MEAKDGSAGLILEENMRKFKQMNKLHIADDGRKVKIIFTKMECKTRVVQLFEAETENQLNYKRRLAGNFK
jgi:hypothetical protein